MKYKIGDRVKIKNFDWYNANKNSEDAIIFQDWRIFYEDMSNFCGKVVTIDAYNPQGDYYVIKEDGKTNFWSDAMFEGLAIEKEPQEKMVSLDDACKWIEDNIFDFPWYDSEGEFSSKDVADAFRKAMEE